MNFLDARHLPCPQPVAQAKLLLKHMQPGERLTIWCKDEMTLLDLKGFCSVANHRLTDVIRYSDYIEVKILR